MRHRILRYGSGGLAASLVCLALLASPLGTWLAGRVLVQLGPERGWQVQVGRTSGWLLISPTLTEVSIANASLGLSLSAERARYAPWSRSLELRSTDLRLGLRGAGETGAPPSGTPGISLPTRSPTTIRVVDGTLTVQRQSDGTGLRLAGVELVCQPDPEESGGDSVVSLDLSARQWQWLGQGEVRLEGAMSGRCRLGPGAVRVDSLKLELTTQAARLSVGIEADVGLSAGFPVEGSATIRASEPLVVGAAAMRLPGPGLEGQARLDYEGRLSPMDLAVDVDGAGHLPRVGPVKLIATGSAGTQLLSLGQARLLAAGGEIELTGWYDAAEDELSARVNWEEVALDQIPGVVAHGTLAGRLRAEGAWKTGRYGLEVEAGIKGYDALPGQPLDLQLVATRQHAGGVRGKLSSEAGELSVRGRLDSRRAYDLSLAGWLDPRLLLGLRLPSVAVQGRVRPDSASAELTVPRLPVGDGGMGPLDVSLLLREGHLLEAELALEGSQAGLRLRTDLRDRSVDSLAAHLAPLPLGRLNGDLGGRISGKATADGVLNLSGARATAQMDLGEVSWKGWSMGAATARLQYEERQLRLDLSGEGVGVSAIADSTGLIRGRADLHAATVSRLREDSPDTAVWVKAQGTVDFAGRSGSPDSLRLDVDLDRVELTTPRWHPAATVDSVRMVFAQGEGKVRPVSALTPLGRLYLRHAEWGEALDVRLGADSLGLTPLHPGLAGTGALALRVEGTPDVPTATGALTVRGISLQGEPLGSLEVELELDDTLTVQTELSQTRRSPQGKETSTEALSVLVTGPAAVLRGESHSSEGMQAQVVGRDLDVGPLLSAVLKDSTAAHLDLTGRAELRAGVGPGEATWRDVDGLLTMTGLRVAKEHLRVGLAGDGARLQLDSAGAALTGVDLQLEVRRRRTDSFAPAGIVSLTGEVGTGYGLGLHLDQVDLLALERLRAPGALSLPEGVLQMAAATGASGDSTWVEAEARVEVEVAGAFSGQLRGGAERGAGEILWESLAGDSLNISLDLPWSLRERTVDWRAARLRAHSAEINPVVFLDAVPELGKLDGRLVVDAQIDGLAGTPVLSGRVGAEDLRFCVLDASPDYLYPSGTLELAGTRCTLTGFAGRSSTGAGQLELSGFVELASLLTPEFSLALEARDIPFSYDDVFEAPEVDLDLTYSRNASEALLAGEVQLSGARAQATLLDFNAALIPRPPAVRSRFLESTQLDVFVDVRDLVAVSELSDLSIEGGVRAYGTLARPRFQGEMAVLEGHVIVLSRTFDFTRGRIVLDKLLPTYSIRELAYDPLLLNPELDMEATTRIKTIDPTDDEEYRDVTMTINGPAQPLAPRFASEGLGDTEIITLLAFGSTSMPTAADQKQYTTALYTAAGQLLLSRQVSKVGLDEFQLLPVGTVLSTANEPAIRIGKHFDAYLPLWVRYEATTSDPSIGQVRLQYDLSSYLKLTGTAESEFVRYGLGIGLKKDF